MFSKLLLELYEQSYYWNYMNKGLTIKLELLQFVVSKTAQSPTTICFYFWQFSPTYHQFPVPDAKSAELILQYAR